MSAVMCYKTKSGEEYIRYYSRSLGKMQADADYMNTIHPEKDPMDGKIPWDEIDYFYASQQEDMY